MNKNKVYLPILFGIAIAAGIFLGTKLNYQDKGVLFSENQKEAKIKRLINYIEYDYVDKVDTDSLLDTAITEMLKNLDPHSVYIPKRERMAEIENMQGKFVGIGVTFMMYQDSVAITSVVEDGPSEKAGLKAGDRIIKAENDTLIASVIAKNRGFNSYQSESMIGDRRINEAVMNTLKGDLNTKVNVTVYRRSTDEVIEFSITRGDVPLKSVTGYYMINNTLGYLNISRFSRSTYDEFKAGMDELINDGMESLVLDLRGNPGGFMDIANRIIDEFLEDGKLIVFTKSKSGQVQNYYATSRGGFENGQVYVLIDQDSASASEILAGALQDNDKGTILGRRSFGKGLVQQEMDLGDGSAVRLTTSRYYTPTGRSIQRPYGNHNPDEYQRDFHSRMLNGELVNKDSIKVNDSLMYKTPKGKIVYGGGGIIPDVFVPIDTVTTYRTKWYRGVNQFAFKYIDTHRNEISAWELKDFVQNFDKDDKIFNEYVATLNLQSQMEPKQRKDLKRFLNSVFARDLFQQTGYFMIAHENDAMIKKVLELEKEKQTLSTKN